MLFFRKSCVEHIGTQVLPYKYKLLPLSQEVQLYTKLTQVRQLLLQKSHVPLTRFLTITLIGQFCTQLLEIFNK